ncbi:MAG: hypothetical protein KC592_02115 [Nitrospira sp.]|nr:hypothetical protein [Nitrospira sp.]
MAAALRQGLCRAGQPVGLCQEPDLSGHLCHGISPVVVETAPEEAGARTVPYTDDCHA